MDINKNINIIPIKSYFSPYLYKEHIREENKSKSGIYWWNNLITSKSYVGSAISLDIRLRDYLSNRFLKKEALRNKSIIYKSLLKYDYNNYTLDVLEYCEPNMLIRREQHYIDMLKPEYNICLIAGSRLGTKHSSETLLKFTRRKFSPEALINLKVAKAGKIPSPLTKINQLLATGHIPTIVNIKDESIKVYNSVRTAAKAIGVSHPTLLDYINNKKLLKDTYLISRKKREIKDAHI